MRCTNRGFAGLAFSAVSTVVLGTALFASPVGALTSDPYGDGSTHTAISGGPNAIDIGDVWFHRSDVVGGGEQLQAHLELPSPITGARLCLQDRAFDGRVDSNPCPSVASTSAGGTNVADFDVVTGSTYVGRDLFAQLVVDNGGTLAFATYYDGGPYFGNTIIPDPHTSNLGPDVCPASHLGQVTNRKYAVNAVSVPTLRGRVSPGAAVVSQFTVVPGCVAVRVSAAAYKATGPVFDQATADQQRLFNSTTGAFDAGIHTLSATAPDCYFQVDLTRSEVLSTSPFYGDRFIDGDNGGNVSCVPPRPAVGDVGGGIGNSAPARGASAASVPAASTSPDGAQPARVLGEMLIQLPKSETPGSDLLARTGTMIGLLLAVGLGMILFGATMHSVASAFVSDKD